MVNLINLIARADRRRETWRPLEPRPGNHGTSRGSAKPVCAANHPT